MYKHISKGLLYLTAIVMLVVVSWAGPAWALGPPLGGGLNCLLNPSSCGGPNLSIEFQGAGSSVDVGGIPTWTIDSLHWGVETSTAFGVTYSGNEIKDDSCAVTVTPNGANFVMFPNDLAAPPELQESINNSIDSGKLVPPVNPLSRTVTLAKGTPAANGYAKLSYKVKCETVSFGFIETQSDLVFHRNPKTNVSVQVKDQNDASYSTHKDYFGVVDGQVITLDLSTANENVVGNCTTTAQVDHPAYVDVSKVNFVTPGSDTATVTVKSDLPAVGQAKITFTQTCSPIAGNSPPDSYVEYAYVTVSRGSFSFMLCDLEDGSCNTSLSYEIDSAGEYQKTVQPTLSTTVGLTCAITAIANPVAITFDQSLANQDSTITVPADVESGSVTYRAICGSMPELSTTVTFTRAAVDTASKFCGGD